MCATYFNLLCFGLSAIEAFRKSGLHLRAHAVVSQLSLRPKRWQPWLHSDVAAGNWLVQVGAFVAFVEMVWCLDCHKC